MGAEQIRVYCDSQLVVNQVLQQYEAREDNLVAYLAQVRKLITGLKGLSISQIPREENAQVVRLARLASSSEVDLQGIRVEYLFEPSVSSSGDMEVDSVDEGPNWMDPIAAYLTNESLPTERSEARRVKYRAAK